MIECSKSERRGITELYCNSTFPESVLPNCQLVGIDRRFIIPCKILYIMLFSVRTNNYCTGNFDERTLLTVSDFPPGNYNFTLSVETDRNVTSFQLPITLSGLCSYLLKTN